LDSFSCEFRVLSIFLAVFDDLCDISEVDPSELVSDQKMTSD
jgi:hypothetical protein